jgi:hypothetical protein
MLIPPLEGTQTRVHDGLFRTWTVDHIPDYDDLPTFEPGMRSPAIVALDNWYINWSGDGELFVFRYAEDGQERHHELDHARFGTVEDAHAAAWAAGLLGLYVYENVAHNYGLPSTRGWARHTPDIVDTLCGEATRRHLGARSATWSRLLDRRHDLTDTMWGQHETLYAVVVFSAYNAINDDTPTADPYIEIEYGFLLCTDRDDPGGTEVWSDYDYDNIRDLDPGRTAAPDALDEDLIADMTASFHNARAFFGMNDDVWNDRAAGNPTLILGARR